MVIVNKLTQVIDYKLVKITINTFNFAKKIINVLIKNRNLLDLIFNKYSLVFTLRFLSSFYYFLRIRRQFSTALYLQMNNLIERKNSRIKAYLQTFVNYIENDWARLLSIAKFLYKNVKNSSNSHTSFELYYSYHFHIFCEKDIDLLSKSILAEKLLTKLCELMIFFCENLKHIKIL